MRIVGTLLAALIAMVVGLAAGAQDRTGVIDTAIKIGVQGPLSGPNASFGAAVYGIQAYYQYVNEKGGVHGRKIEVILGDTACNEAKGVAVAKKFISQDQVFLINGGVCSGVALAMRPVIEESGVPWVVSTAVHTNEWSKGYRDPMVTHLKATGITPVAEVTLERGQTDATAQVLRLKEADLDFVVAILYEPEIVVFLRDAYKLGLKAPKIGSLGADFLNTEKRLGSREPMENFYQLFQYKDLIDGPGMKHAREIIEPRLPAGEKVTDFTFYGPGSSVAVVHVLEKIGRDLSREKFIAEMENLKDFDTGMIAGKLSYSPTNHQGAKQLYTIGYDANGKIIVYEAWGQRAPAQM